jgi:hypothetical protein
MLREHASPEDVCDHDREHLPIAPDAQWLKAGVE